MKDTPARPAEKVTAQDVARLAGVSQSAVSRVFTPGASASNATAAKVRAAAEQLGYRPNILARSLITGRTRMIGLVVAYLDNQFYPVALELLSRALQARGYHILVFMAENETKRVAEVMEELLDYQVDGIVTASVAMTNDLTARCDAAGIPVVMFNRSQDDPRLSAVTSDNIAGGRRATEYLIRSRPPAHRACHGLAGGLDGPRPRRGVPAGDGRGGPRAARDDRRHVRPRHGGAGRARPFRRHHPARRDLRRQRSHGLRRDGHAADGTGPVDPRAMSRSSAMTTCPSRPGPAMT